MKRILAWAAAVLVVLAGALWLLAQISPLPSVFAIRYIFSRGDAAAMAALATHVPPGVAERLDLAYGDGADETFDLFYPEGTATPLPTIVWVHGGAWIAGSKSGVANYLRILASHGYSVIGIDYTVAPTAIYPAQTQQVMDALGYVSANAEALNVDPDRIFLAGDSAGAQLAAQAAAILTSPVYGELVGITPSIEPGQLTGVLLFCGAYDIAGVDLDGEFGWLVRTVLWAYTGARDVINDPATRTASVVNFVTGDFPATFITGGNGDPLTPQSRRMADRLGQQGVPVQSLFFPEELQPSLPHEYQFNLDRPEGHEALEEVLAFLETALAEPGGDHAALASLPAIPAQ